MTRLVILLTATLSLNGCAVYTVTSAASLVTTSKSLTDHATSMLAQADCNAVRMVSHASYYCEVNDPSKTYNRNGF